MSAEARFHDTAYSKANNLLISVQNFYNQANVTSTDNATFDIGNDFNNGFYLNGTEYDGGNISADKFNVVAGQRFFNGYNATISADNFNVSAADDFLQFLYSSTINADNFNVTARYFENYNATINANDFNVSADSFYNSATISADNLNISYRRLLDNDRDYSRWRCSLFWKYFYRKCEYLAYSTRWSEFNRCNSIV